MDYLSLDGSTPVPEADPNTVSIITQALIDKFGDRAGYIAERQLVTASNESHEKWLEVVSRLTR